jgi:hypothetical protein
MTLSAMPFPGRPSAKRKWLELEFEREKWGKKRQYLFFITWAGVAY